MQLRMLERRSLNGSMTVVGDIAQATGQWAHGSWDEILEPAPPKRPPRRAELTLGYRLPAPIMALAARVLRRAAPDLARPARSARTVREPAIRRAAPGRLAAEVAAVAAGRAGRGRSRPGGGDLPGRRWSTRCARPSTPPASPSAGRPANGLEHRVAVVEVGLVKGLEVDAAVVVEPAAMVDEEAQGDRALYVALTRATKRLAVVHELDLPPSLLP